ncbi:hypothetical protein [Vogesella mureinivorans]|uniref:hypothetical protein n=1 Tax=Vogesella mureinivorans TaxID=657276 RepID=UPI0011C9D486|nr:hypothetical protein [Vogesella mureinivorans]
MPPLLKLLLQPLQALWHKHRDAWNKPHSMGSAYADDNGELLEDDLCFQHGHPPPRYPRFRPTVSRNAAIRAAFVSRGHGLRSTRRLAPGSACLLDDGQQLYLGDDVAATQHTAGQVGRNTSH